MAGHRILLFFDGEAQNHVPESLGDERPRFLPARSDNDPRPQIHLPHYLIAPERNESYTHTYRQAETLKNAFLRDPRVRPDACALRLR